MSHRDLEPRVAALEVEMVGVKQEIRDFRRATASSFNALRSDFTDLRAEFAELRNHIDHRFEQVDRGFMEMRGMFDATAAGQRRIVELLESVIADRDR